MLLFIVLVGGFLYYFKYIVEARVESSAAEFIVDDGESITSVANDLNNRGLIKSSRIFLIYEKIKNRDVKSGDYLIPANQNIVEISEILFAKAHQVNKITIPEGWRREQIAASLQNKLNIPADEFMTKTEGLEGKLFPDTFKFSDQPTADEVIKKMTDDFDIRTEDLNLSENDLILASIIEREAGGDADRAGISAVFKNRLDIGMKLQSDITVIYQRDSNEYESEGLLNYKFWKKLSSGDITNVVGPYSTYKITALPPAPICNPGLASIIAAQNPDPNNHYLYFLYGTDGMIHYATTQAQQDANALKYM